MQNGLYVRFEAFLFPCLEEHLMRFWGGMETTLLIVSDLGKDKDDVTHRLFPV